ncbi:MAG: magnesium transporter MgtE N-terminal domain-containing protein [Candidatus Kapaibacteriota bacterium]|jgi:flagellar motility protein MotE (MotC chaperone)
MNVKQALLILLIVLGSLIFLFLALLGLYKFAPGFFGIQSDEQKKEPKPEEIKEQFKSEPKVVLSKYEYDEWLQKSFNAFAVVKENQFLVNYSKYLQDSLTIVNSKLKEIQTDNIKLIDSLNKIHTLINEKKLENSKLLSQISQKEKELAELKSFLQKQKESGKALTDSAKLEVYKTFAKIYENANPEEVAKVIENLEDKDALALLKLMNKKKAGKIIDRLKPERSAQILEASFK